MVGADSRRLTRRFQWVRGSAHRLILSVGVIPALTAAVGAHAFAQSTFDETFDSYSNGSSIDSLAKWIANSIGTNIPYVSNPGGTAGTGVIPIRTSFAPTAFIQPFDTTTSLPASWPFARTCERFLRVYFDVRPTLISSGGGIYPDGVIGLYFTPTAKQAGLYDTGVLAAVQISWTNGTTAKAQIYAKEPGGTVKPVGGQIDIGSIGSGRTLRIDYAWDYFTLPHDFQPSGSWPPTHGDPWVNLRLSWWDSTANQWIQPSLGPGRNGWMEFGTAGIKPGTYGEAKHDPIGFTRYDWTDPSHANFLDVFVHWYAEQGGGTGQVDWAIDNVHIGSVKPQAFSIMSNELGYDPAGHGWVAMRPNDPDVRALGQNAIATLGWSLHTSTGTTIASQALLSPPGEQCFKEVTDPEDWDGTEFPLAPLYWWRWEWPDMPSLAGMTGVYVTAEGTLTGLGTPFICTSDPFDVQADLAYSTLIGASNNLAAKNGLMRHAYSHPPWTYPPSSGSAGWFDAGNENGENRAHGLFVSALCSILKQRRGELSTAQTRDLVAEIRWGADFLLLMGPPENGDPTRYSNHAQQGPTWEKKLAGHHLANVPPPPLELAGHIFHEHQSRRPARHPFDANDQKNVALRVYLSALGLYDAARTLRSFVQSTSTTDAYFAQANDSRSYLYDLYQYWLIHSGNNPDFFLPYRSQAMLDVAAYDYSGLSSDLDGATQKMVNDLAGRPPTTSANIAKFWVLGGMFSNAPGGGAPDTSAYSPFEPLLYFVEHGVPDLLPPAPPHPLWQDALYDIGEIYYHQTILSGSGNPLRITRYWPTDIDANDFYGQDVFSNHRVAEEAYATARLAQNATRAGVNYDRLVQLATGGLNWILGLHRGALARHVQSSSGLAETDLGFSPVCTVANVGRRFGVQIVYGLHSADWTQPTTLSGLGGQQTDITDPNTIWPVAPFEFSRGVYNTTESYIKTDGNVLMAVETLGRVLHPRGLIEAENYSSASGSPTTEPNNEWGVGGVDRPNGGSSVTGLDSNNWLQWNVLPPEPVLDPSASNAYDYTLLVRAGNISTSGPVTASVDVYDAAGTPIWTGSVSIPYTGAKHEYEVVSTSSSSPILLTSGVPYAIKLTFPGGPCSVDDLVLVSGGVMQ